MLFRSNDTATTEIYTCLDTLSLHDALPISARGVRVSAVLLDGPDPVAYYDGRATAEQNWEEQTGLATLDTLGSWSATGDRPVGASPHGLGGLRYVTAVPLPDGTVRLYVEVTREDGAHDLRTVLVAADGTRA